jgi:Collagen triple helix repeat (20 copies)
VFSLVRRHLSVGSLLAFVALVFAMSGCGFALSAGTDLHAAAAKKKKSKVVVGPRGPEGKQGKEGKEGKQGLQGVEGEKGAQGNPGTQGNLGVEGKEGKEGKAGKGVVVAEEPSGTAHCEGDGGASVEAEGSGVKHYACNGKEGPEGPKGPAGPITGQLPHGVTETGAWVVRVEIPNEEETKIFTAPISFTLQPAKALEGSNVEYVKKGETGANCKGNAETPTAPVGFLCVYGEEEPREIAALVRKAAGPPNAGAATAGAYLFYGAKTGEKETEPGNNAYGTWALTGE